MDLQQALDSAIQVLNEERTRPTAGYRDNLIPPATGMSAMDRLGAAFESLSHPRVAILRKESPRIVSEIPEAYVFGGTNFDLLMTIFSQVPTDLRDQFISSLLVLVEKGGYCSSVGGMNYYPRFQGKVSDTPLIAEFCIRTGYVRALLDRTSKVKVPTVGIAIMMMHIEESIALNFNVFSDQELSEIPALLKPLHDMAYLQTHSAIGPNSKQMTPNPHYKAGREKEASRIVGSIDAIDAECRQARYLYLKGKLQQTVNLEVESDKAKVVNYLVKLGFSKDMVGALNAAEAEYKSTATVFELKNCFGHLRSFLEFLHRESANAIAGAAGETVAEKWGAVTLYLRQKGLFTTQHESFAISLYTLMSDTSVHPLVAEREYARLLRNVVIEYGVMFLTILDKNGVKIS